MEKVLKQSNKLRESIQLMSKFYKHVHMQQTGGASNSSNELANIMKGLEILQVKTPTLELESVSSFRGADLNAINKGLKEELDFCLQNKTQRNEEKNELEKRIADLESQLRDVHDKHVSTQADKDNEVTRLKEELDGKIARISELEYQLNQKTDELDALNTNVTNILKMLDELKKDCPNLTRDNRLTKIVMERTNILSNLESYLKILDYLTNTHEFNTRAIESIKTNVTNVKNLIRSKLSNETIIRNIDSTAFEDLDQMVLLKTSDWYKDNVTNLDIIINNIKQVFNEVKQEYDKLNHTLLGNMATYLNENIGPKMKAELQEQINISLNVMV